MDWERFLRLARCPRCRARLSKGFARIACENGHAVSTTQTGVPLFAPPLRPLVAREQAERRRHVDAYAGINAYGYQVIGSGHAEGLYRTVSDLLIRALPWDTAFDVLEVGSGAGRSVRDLAAFFARAFVLGIDRDEVALDLACAALTSGASQQLDLRRLGFGRPTLPGSSLSNIFLAQALVEQLPLARPEEGGGFEAVVAVNLLDRVSDPIAALISLAAFVKPGGVLLLTDPLDWWQLDGALWDRFGRGLEGILGLVQEQGFTVEFAVDGLLYRELNDARGSCTDWPVAVALGRRTG